MKTSAEIGEIAKALAVAQGEMKGALKDSNNPFFKSKYADLGSVWDACRAPLTKNGLCVVQFPKSKFYGTPEVYEWKSKSGEPQYGVKVVYEVSVLTRIGHSSGQWMEDRISTLLPNGNPQAVGSAITYLRRYALQSVAGIAPEDDDAEGATPRNGNDHHDQRRPEERRPAPAPMPEPLPAPDYPVITDVQGDAIRAGAKAAGLKTLGQLKDALRKFAGTDDVKRVPVDKFEHVMVQLDLLGAPDPFEGLAEKETA